MDFGDKSDQKASGAYTRVRAIGQAVLGKAKIKLIVRDNGHYLLVSLRLTGNERGDLALQYQMHEIHQKLREEIQKIGFTCEVDAVEPDILDKDNTRRLLVTADHQTMVFVKETRRTLWQNQVRT